MRKTCFAPNRPKGNKSCKLKRSVFHQRLLQQQACVYEKPRGASGPNVLRTRRLHGVCWFQNELFLSIFYEFSCQLRLACMNSDGVIMEVPYYVHLCVILSFTNVMWWKCSVVFPFGYVKLGFYSFWLQTRSGYACQGC